MSDVPDPPRLANARRFLVGYSNGELGEVLHLLSPDVVYTIAGHNPFAGTFHGPAEVERHLNRLFDFLRGTFDVLKFEDWMLGDSHVCALQYAQAQRHGVIYRGHQLFLMGFDQRDTLSSIDLFFEDQAQADSLLTQ